MTTTWLRRAVLTAVCASAALLAACGSSTIESQLTPTRFISFGDAFADLGQTGSRYTVNDGSVNNWTQQMAADFGVPMAAVVSGGFAYAQGNARITAKPDAAGSSATPTVQQQIDTFLAGNTIGASDVVVLAGGTADIIAEMAAVLAGTQTSAQMMANVQQAGRDLGAQIRRLTLVGGQHVVVAGVYNLSVTPWATRIGQGALLSDASSAFNQALLVSIVDLGNRVLYVDAAYYYNLVAASPTIYAINDATSVVCTSVDPGNGIGTGVNQVNSALCTPSTIAPGADYSKFMFADGVYMTPQAQRVFGDYAYNRVRARW
ncbi:SGNH/GDSL hydrolase family protein [Variovorax terrae]|uniref:SGNH/GDSL hydrolase family protein n=1 Tax=Variovorax terrae TaxID=2923278 RepID=A0A9X1VZM7_9BURK|nr:SGNH/GDSL hydrolase family protein [Variovorax terrae]MCJ0765870.1 SGNH/GDSL hydrolase family protein [Variovorax terrae]